MPEQALICPVALEMEPILEWVEELEPWVYSTDERLLQKRRLLAEKLLQEKSSLPDAEFLRLFVTVAAYSSFRETLTLLHLLGTSRPRLLSVIIRQVGGNTLPDPRDCWGALRWRVRYATVFSTLSRVFAPQRLQLINQAIKRS